jgi:transposase InsO family protein
MCRVLQVTRGGYYAWRRRPESIRTQRNRALHKEIHLAHTASRGTYGSPRIYRQLVAQGHAVGRHRIARLMRKSGLKARCRRRFRTTTQSNHAHPIAKNLLERRFAVESPDRAWVTDITYIWTQEGWLYLAVILDLYSRRVIGWSMGARIDQELTLRALRMALANRGTTGPLIHHSDRGSQYAATAYRDLLKVHGVACSMSRKGDCWDNAVAESFFATLKMELVYRTTFWTREQARRAIFEYVEGFYNRVRRHSYLGFVSPEAFEQQSTSISKAAQPNCLPKRGKSNARRRARATQTVGSDPTMLRG